MECKIEIVCSGNTPIGIASGLINRHNEKAIENMRDMAIPDAVEQMKIMLVDLEEIANHLINYVEASRKRLENTNM
jgi:Ni,Fe-hydrogenase III large subunit